MSSLVRLDRAASSRAQLIPRPAVRALPGALVETTTGRWACSTTAPLTWSGRRDR